MKWRQIATDYLSFSKKDRIGILAILTFILIIYLLPLLFAKDDKLSFSEGAGLLAIRDTLETKQIQQDENDEQNETSDQFEPLTKQDFTKKKPFSFDPNSLNEDGWRNLGLKKRTIKTIINYRNKGGKFYKPEDLQKIWGLPQGFYEHVRDYINISKVSYPDDQKHSPTVNAKREKRVWNIEINSTDTTALIELPGIGSKLALRIINFRDKLGGFYSVDQVKETYGLADSSFQKIKPYLHISREVRKLNINSATKDELKLHPYIKWNLANALVEFRDQHGNYKSIDEIKNIKLIDEKTFVKLSNYLAL